MSMRGKEEAFDYRYFPEPDLLPLEVPPGWEEAIQSRLPELPAQMRERFKDQYQLGPYDVGVPHQFEGNRNLLRGDGCRSGRSKGRVELDFERSPS